MKTIRNTISRTALITFACVGFLTTQAEAGISFTIDTFTTDNLTIRMAVDGTTLAGPEPVGLELNRLGIYATDINEAAGWKGTNTPTITKAGSIGGRTIGNVSTYTTSGLTVITINFTTNLALSESVTTEMVVSLYGTQGLDTWRPDAISSFTLVWGVPATNAQHGFGTFQSTAVNPNQAVPEPSTAIAMGLLGIVGFAGNRRRRRQESVA